LFNRTTSTKLIAPSGLEALRAGRPRRPRIKIRIPKLEISNKPKSSNPKIEIQNDLGKNPKSEYRNTKQFQNLNFQNPKPSNENFSRIFKCFEISILSFPFLFRVSDFVLRICNLYLACFASLQLALWNSASGEQLGLGRVGIPRGEPSSTGNWLDFELGRDCR